MILDATKKLMEKMRADGVPDSYAVLLMKNGEKAAIFSENVKADTYFDIASMGKVLTTATLILKAIGAGKLSLDDTLEKFFPYVPEKEKNITVKQLMTHTSGIVRCGLSQEVCRRGRKAIAEAIFANPLAYEPGKRRIYSCNAYILLGFIVEEVYGMRLNEAFENNTKKDLDLKKSGFNIAVDEPNAVVSYRRWNAGEYRVDDENVYAMVGIAGSGAQFWTLADMEKFCDAIMRKEPKLYPEYLYDMAEQNYTKLLGDEANGLGWLFVDERYPQTGTLFPTGSFGHCGHTGTSMFFNRKENLYAVILTNATRCLWVKNRGTGYDYNTTCGMREEIHNALQKDLEKEN